MSRNRKNNHYHYAEQYTDGAYQRRVKTQRVLHLPRKAVFFAVLVLLAFGVISTTFSANNPSVDENSGGGIIVRVRSNKVAQDYVAAGMNRDEADALAMTGAAADFAETGTNIGSTSFYYGGTNNGWTLTAMTKHSSGYYSYAAVSAGARFKVSSSNSSYTFDGDLGFDFYGMSGVFSRYTGSNWLTTSNASNGKLYRYNDGNNYPCHDPGTSYDGSGDNFYIKNAGYVLVWYAYTDLRENAKPIITVVSSLPAAPYYRVHYNNGQWRDQTFTTSANPVTHSSTWSCTINLDGNATDEFLIQKVFSTTYPNKGTISYKRGNDHDYYYNTGAWTCGNESTDTSNLWLHTVITGTYTFTINSTQWYDKKVNFTVAFPSYTVTTSIADDDGDNSVTTSNTATPTSTTVAIGSSVTLTATDNDSAYSFYNWTVTSGAAKTGEYANGTAIGSSGDSTNPITVYPSGTSATVNLQANYKINKYRITYNMDATPATAASNTISNPASAPVPTDAKKTHGADYTITSNKYIRQDGYTQVGWSTTPNRNNTTGNGYYAFGATYATNAELTLYPVWRLDAPTKGNDANQVPQLTIPGSSSMVVGGTAVELSLDVSTESADVTRSYSYTWSGSSGTNGANVTFGTDPTDTDNFLKFTADIPGTYTVSVTVTDVSSTNVTNANNTAAATTNTVTITVTPDAPQFNITVYNYVDQSSEGKDGNTAANAYMILLGNRYYFSAAVVNPDSNYTYTWSTAPDFSNDHVIKDSLGSVFHGDSITFTNVLIPNSNPEAYDVDLISYDPNHAYDPDAEPGEPNADPRTLAKESDGSTLNVTLYCRAERNSVYKDSSAGRKYYYIQPLIKSFVYEPMQKIFNMNDQTVTLAAEYNIANNPAYTTDLKFSNNNKTYTSALDAPAQGFISSFDNAIRAYLYPTGPKFFYLFMTGPNAQGQIIQSRSDTIHTTVGTADSTAHRTIYFNTTAQLNLKNYLVMCYYIDGDGDLKYQVAQDLKLDDDTVGANNEVIDTNSDDGLSYRMMIPEDAQAVCFGFIDSDNSGVRYYDLPVNSGGTISGFADTIFYGYTNQITLDDSVCVINVTGSSTVGLFEVFTCTSSAR